jgi:hypothetical protein
MDDALALADPLEIDVDGDDLVSSIGKTKTASGSGS